jgi:hypothetical protein
MVAPSAAAAIRQVHFEKEAGGDPQKDTVAKE